MNYTIQMGPYRITKSIQIFYIKHPYSDTEEVNVLYTNIDNTDVRCGPTWLRLIK